MDIIMTKVKTSKAAVLTGIRQMEMQEFPIPEIHDDDGLLKVEMVGVCGSDPGYYRGKTKATVLWYKTVLDVVFVSSVLQEIMRNAWMGWDMACLYHAQSHRTCGEHTANTCICHRVL